MYRIAIVQSGPEVAHQHYADAGAYTAELFDGRRLGGIGPVDVYTDAAVSALGGQLSRYAAIVFASNCFLSTDVRRVVTRLRRELDAFAQSGGGIVLLYQYGIDDLSTLPLGGLTGRIALRETPLHEHAFTAVDADDVLLNYPADADVGALRDPPAVGRTPYRSFNRGLVGDSLGGGLKSVVTEAGLTVLARSGTGSGLRVAVSTMPLDWLRADAFLENAVHFAVFGTPIRALYLSAPESNELLTHWFEYDRASAIRPLPTDPPARIDRWLLRHVESCTFTASADALHAASLPAFKAFVAGGGAMISEVWDHATEQGLVEARVGAYVEHDLARRLRLAIRSLESWETNAQSLSFPLRNIVSAIAFLEQLATPGDPLQITVGSLETARRQIVERLRRPEQRGDFSSAVAIGQTLVMLRAPKRQLRAAVEWMQTDVDRRAPEIRLQVEALLAAAAGDEFDVGQRAAAAIAAGPDAFASLGAVVRLCDALLFSARHGSATIGPADAASIANAVIAVLEGNEPDSRFGWLSLESTAEIVLGLELLADRGLQHADPEAARRGRRLTARALGILRRGAGSLRADTNGVATLARITEALITVGRRHPIAAQQLAALHWPAAIGWIGTPGAAGDEDAVVARLAEENERLRAIEAERRNERAAVVIGRTVATAAGAVLALLPGALGIYLVRNQGALAVFGAASGLVAVTTLWTHRVGRALSWLGLLPRRVAPLWRWLSSAAS